MKRITVVAAIAALFLLASCEIGFFINPVPETLWRIQLTWTDPSLDLDAHLTGPTSGFERFHIYPASMSYPSDSSLPEVFIDIDDSGAYREENVYIRTQRSGEYHYYVHNYSAQSANAFTSSYTLSSSGATVRLYREGLLQDEYTVPSGTEGNCWNVLTISDAFHSVLNTIDYMSDPTEPRSLSSQPEKADAERLKAVIGAKLIR